MTHNIHNGNDKFAALMWFIGIIVACFFVFIIWSVATSTAERRIQTEINSPRLFVQFGNSQAEKCLNNDKNNYENCIQLVLKTNRENHLAELNSQTQIDIANYTFWLFLIAVITALLTLLGIGFVSKNLKEMQKTNSLTFESISIAQASHRFAVENKRPWVIFADIEVTNWKFYPGTTKANALHVSIKLHLKNVGESPAVNVLLSGYFGEHLPNSGDYENFIVHGRENIKPKGQIRTFVLAPNQVEQIEFSESWQFDNIANDALIYTNLKFLFEIEYGVGANQLGKTWAFCHLGPSRDKSSVILNSHPELISIAYYNDDFQLSWNKLHLVKQKDHIE